MKNEDIDLAIVAVGILLIMLLLATGCGGLPLNDCDTLNQVNPALPASPLP
jgi:hypothetical protein